jgi:hypothetical protein
LANSHVQIFGRWVSVAAGITAREIEDMRREYLQEQEQRRRDELTFAQYWKQDKDRQTAKDLKRNAEHNAREIRRLEELRRAEDIRIHEALIEKLRFIRPIVRPAMEIPQHAQSHPLDDMGIRIDEEEYESNVELELMLIGMSR